ncbi:MAG TPA: trigger factor [Candidatus Sulfotelmatobacter sp.]|nr:trigger factor [Candidatus Sulfotelmatobacter sp.]
MQVTETLAEGLKRQFKVTLPAQELDQKLDQRLRQLGATARLPGFRPGKVPLPLLKKRYGGSLLGEILEQAVQDSSSRAMAERGLRAATVPKIEITAFAEGKDLEYTLALELLPEIKPIDFGTLALERLKADVTDEEVDQSVERIRERSRRTEPVSPPRPAATGDTVMIDFEGKVDGEAFAGGEAKDFPLELGTGRFIPGFEDQLVGANAGESRTVAVTFPTDYPAEKLAGKEAAFAVTIKEVRAPVTVPLDDEFAKTLGVDSLEALRRTVREQIERDYAAAARLKLKRKLLDKLAEAHHFTVPDGMVDGEFDAIWKQASEAKERGALEPELAAKSEDELKAEYRGIAERRVRLGLLLSEVGRLNNIQVSEDELKRAMIEEARRYPGQERQVIEHFRKNREAMDGLRAPIFEEKVIDFIVEMATVQDRKVTPAELFADDDDKPAAV